MKWFTVLATALSISAASMAFGQEGVSGNSASISQTAPRHWRGHGFKMGLCVGQALATANPPIILQPGQRMSSDPTLKAAFQAAKEACRAQSGRVPANSTP